MAFSFTIYQVVWEAEILIYYPSKNRIHYFLCQTELSISFATARTNHFYYIIDGQS